MTFTPGPWKFVRASKSGINQENDHLIYNEQKRHIAEVFQYQEHEFIISLSEAEANARLIAAAPEMFTALEATQKLLDEIYEEDIVLSQNLDAVYEKNKQALAQLDN